MLAVAAWKKKTERYMLEGVRIDKGSEEEVASVTPVCACD